MVLFSQRPRAVKRFKIAVAGIALSSFLLLVLAKHWGVADLRLLRAKISASSPEAPPPKTSSTGIPKKLWYKLGPKGLTDETRAWTDTCVQNNTDYRVEFLTEETANAYVQKEFGPSNPDMVKLYHGLSVPILKADILRYLLLYSEGGVYLDLDVSCEAPISEWIPAQYKDKAALVVGWEFDVGWGDNFVREFETWTIMAAPRSPHIWMVIKDILQDFHKKMEEKNITAGELTQEIVGDVVDATGPRRFTKNVLKSLEKTGVRLDDIKALMEPKLVGDILVQPGYVFAANSNHWPEDMKVPPPMVIHHFAGSWKNDKGGEMVD